MSAVDELRATKDRAQKALRKAEKAYHEYAIACWNGRERTKAFAIWENIRDAGRIHK